MRTAYVLTLAAALAGSVVLSMSAGAVEVCDKSCVGPACVKDCVREPDVTVGRERRDRNEVIIEERDRRRDKSNDHHLWRSASVFSDSNQSQNPSRSILLDPSGTKFSVNTSVFRSY